MLLNNNIIDSKRIVFNSIENAAHIENCDVSIHLNIKTLKNVIHTSMHVRKIMIIALHNEIVVSIYYIIISANRDFLFELKEIKFSFYVHLINVDLKNILIKNDDDKII